MAAHSKFKQIITTVLAWMMLAALPSHAQTTFQIGLGGGLVSPTAQYGGTVADYYNGAAFGLNTGWNIHAKARSWGPLIGSYGELGYSSLNNNGTVQSGHIDIGQKIITIKAGPEIHLGVPLLPFTPYAGANIAVNFFGGASTFSDVPDVPNGTYTSTGATRLGFGLALGTLIDLFPATALDIAIGYNFMNVFGWNWEQGQGTRADAYRSLNDDADPQFTAADGNHFVGATRHIQSLDVSLSLMIGP